METLPYGTIILSYWERNHKYIHNETNARGDQLDPSCEKRRSISGLKGERNILRTTKRRKAE